MDKPKRRCMAWENGFRFKGCKGYIDNHNRFYCSYCHAYISRMDGDGLIYHQDGECYPSSQKTLGGESISPDHKIIYGSKAK